MAGFADLVKKAQPALYGGGMVGQASAGRTWEWPFVDIVDDNDDPIDLTDVDGTCVVWTAPGGSVVATLVFAGGLGSFTIGLDEADTVGLFDGGTDTNGRKLCWSFVLDDGTDSVQVWMVDNSPFTVKRGA